MSVLSFHSCIHIVISFIWNMVCIIFPFNKHITYWNNIFINKWRLTQMESRALVWCISEEKQDRCISCIIEYDWFGGILFRLWEQIWIYIQSTFPLYLNAIDRTKKLHKLKPIKFNIILLRCSHLALCWTNFIYVSN